MYTSPSLQHATHTPTPSVDSDFEEAAPHVPLDSNWRDNRRDKLAQLFEKQRQQGLTRPSESAFMNSLPFNPSLCEHAENISTSHNNKTFSAPDAEAMATPDSTICTPPSTGPVPGQTIDDWIAAKHADRNAEVAAYNARVTECTRDGMPTPAELFSDPNDWKRCCDWFTAYQTEFRLCERDNWRRFRYSKLPSGRDGIRIPSSELDPKYRGVNWEVTGVDTPCKPRTWRPPQQATEWKLDAMWTDAVESWHLYERGGTAPPFPDMEIVYALRFVGLTNKSTADRGVVLAPNYNKFWQQGTKFARDKTAEKRRNFTIPRVSEPFDFLPCIPIDLLPRSLVTDQFDSNGKQKPRLTVDPGYGGRHGQKDPNDSDPSIDGNCDTSDPYDFPTFEYMRVSQLAHDAAIMMVAGEPLGRRADDFETYYEQIAKEFFSTSSSVQWIVADGPQIDWRLIFGFRAEPGLSNRVSFFIKWRMKLEVDNLQRAWEISAKRVPPAVHKWTEERRAAGFSGAWSSIGLFFDDVGTVAFLFFIDEVLRGQQTVWTRYGISCADGRLDADSGRQVKNKRQRATPDEELVLLGLVPDVRPPGQLTLGSGKREQYIADGEVALDSARRDPHKRLEIKPAEKYVGRIGFAASVDPELKSALQTLRSVLGASWQSTHSVRLTPLIEEAVDQISSRLRQNTGIALLPTAAKWSGEDCPLVYTFADAARQPDAPADRFVGYGVWVWPLASDTIFFTNGQWTKLEQELDSTALELLTKNIALNVANNLVQRQHPERKLPATDTDNEMAHTAKHAIIGEFRFCDIIQVGDNSATQFIGNSGSAKGPAQRALNAQRTRWLQEHRVRVLSVHAVRDTLGMQGADDLSKGDEPHFRHVVSNLFGRQMKYERLPQVDSAARSSEAALLALRHPKHGRKKKRRRQHQRRQYSHSQ